jgi:hypothetical protein
MMEPMASDPTVDDAIGAIMELFRTRRAEIGAYGYDVYLPKLWNVYAIASKMVLAGERDALDRVGLRVSGIFYAAAWELCRRGILRPGIRNVNLQHTDDGAAGNGYSITPTGERRLTSADPGLHIPTEPSRLAAILADFSLIVTLWGRPPCAAAPASAGWEHQCKRRCLHRC